MDRISGDGAYDTWEIRSLLKEKGIEGIIPRRRTQFAGWIKKGQLIDIGPNVWYKPIGPKEWKQQSGYHRRSLSEKGSPWKTACASVPRNKIGRSYFYKQDIFKTCGMARHIAPSTLWVIFEIFPPRPRSVLSKKSFDGEPLNIAASAIRAGRMPSLYGQTMAIQPGVLGAELHGSTMQSEQIGCYFLQS